MKFVTLAAAMAVSLACTPAFAGGFMSIPDIPGESRAAAHQGWIEIESVRYGAQQQSPARLGSGRQRARGTANDIVITKAADQASPYLFLSSLQGKAFAEIVIDMTSPTAPARVKHKFTLSNATITSVDTVIGADGETREEIAIRYQKINQRYVGGAANARAGDEHEIEYDVAAGI